MGARGRPALDDGRRAARKVARADVREVEPGLTGIGLEPEFGIGQRMLLVENAAGNVLWDMIPAVTDEAVEAVARAGPVSAIAISHPHYYSACRPGARRSATCRSSSTPPIAST